MRFAFIAAKKAEHRVTILCRCMRVTRSGFYAWARRGLSARAQRDLERMGVEVRVNSMVTNVTADGIHIGEEFIPVRNVFWAAGVKASGLGATLGVPLDRAGRVKVGPDLTIPGHPEVFVTGDMAAATSADTGQPVPGVAQGGLQMGHYAGARIARETSGRATPADRKPFVYRDKGSLATIGRSAAVADLSPRLRFGGYVAWVAHAIVTPGVTMFDANIFHPHHGTLAYSEPNLGAGLIAVPAYLLSGGNPYAAHDHATQALNGGLSGDNAAGLNGVKGAAEIYMGRYQDAVRSTSAASDEAENLFNKGLAQLLNKDYQNALTSFNEATSKDSNLAVAYSGAAVAASRLGNNDQVVSHLSKAVSNDPSLKEAALSDLEFEKLSTTESFRNALR